MPAWLRLTGNILKTFWWVIVLIVVAITTAGGVIYLVKNRKKKVSENDTRITESFVDMAASRVSNAVTDAKVEHAVIKAETTMKKKELENIRKEPDGRKRREKLASILQKSL